MNILSNNHFKTHCTDNCETLEKQKVKIKFKTKVCHTTCVLKMKKKILGKKIANVSNVRKNC